MNCQYVQDYYKVRACIGRRVIVYGAPGIIAEDRGHYIGVTLDSEKPGTVSNYHPTDQVEYLDMGKVRKVPRSRERYQRYLEYGECFSNFIEFCRWDAAPQRSWNGGFA